MTVTIDNLTPVETTLLITLTGRALDARTKRPLLGDRLAAMAFDRIGPSADIVKLPDGSRVALAVRSKMLDRLVAGFIAARNAVVVELGCGLAPACTASPRRRLSTGTTSTSTTSSRCAGS